MKLQVLQENFAKSINIASRFTSVRAQLPVLSNIHLQAKSNKLYLSATNLENSVSLSVGAKVDKEGEITIPARVINEIVSTLNPGTLTIVVEKDVVKLSSDGFKTSISGMNASDFPSVPKKIGKDAVLFNSTDFLTSLNKVIYSTSSDETRPLLTGVLFKIEPKKVSLVATDGFRLSSSSFPIEIKEGLEDIILPKGVLSELVRLGNDEEEIAYSFKKGDSQVVFRVGSIVLSSRVLEGEYPDYKKIIPKELGISVNLDKKELHQAIKLASVFAKDSANVVKMGVKKSGLEIFSESQYSGSQTSKVEAKVEGNKLSSKSDFVIAFNYRFIDDFLSIVQGDDIELSFNEPNTPGLFKDLSEKKYLHLIMPVKLQS